MITSNIVFILTCQNIPISALQRNMAHILVKHCPIELKMVLYVPCHAHFYPQMSFCTNWLQISLDAHQNNYGIDANEKQHFF